MQILKNFVQVSTDLFVRFNEQVAERMKEMKIDAKYSNELIETVHHIRDKNELYIELASFWARIEKELPSDQSLNTNSFVQDALKMLNENVKAIYDRRSDPKQSKSVELLSGVEKFSDELAAKFLEFGLNAQGRKKDIFNLIVKFQEDFHKLPVTANTTTADALTPLWNSFQNSVLNAN